jgi:tetratricopeptide (TPR) repeat protein
VLEGAVTLNEDMELDRLEQAIDDRTRSGRLREAKELSKHYMSLAGEQAVPDGGLLSRVFRANYLAAQVYLAAGELEVAWELLEQLSVPSTTESNPIAKRVLLLRAECLQRLGRRTECLQELQAAGRIRVGRDPLIELRELRIRLWLGEVSQLTAELRSCRRALAERHDIANVTLLWCEEGKAWEIAGDHKRAMLAWKNAEQHFAGGTYGGQIFADVFVQLGRFRHLEGHLQQASDYFTQGLNCVSAESPHTLELRLRRVLVWTDLNLTQMALQELASITKEIPLHDFPTELRALYRLVCAVLGNGADESANVQAVQGGTIVDTWEWRLKYLAAEAGTRENAIQLLRAIAEGSALPQSRARHALALGLLALASRDSKEARVWLNNAIELSEKHNLPEVLWRAFRARGRVAGELERNETLARDDFERSVMVNEEQATKIHEPAIAVRYRQRRADVLTELLRAACLRSDPEAAFRCQELRRGRLLVELSQTRRIPTRVSDSDQSVMLDNAEAKLAELYRRLAAIENGSTHENPGPELAELCIQVRQEEIVRDRLVDASLTGHRRNSICPIPTLEELRKRIPVDSIFIVICDLGDSIAALVCSRDVSPYLIISQHPIGETQAQIGSFNHCIENQLTRYRRGLPIGKDERAEVDRHLTSLGEGPLGKLIASVLARHSSKRLVIVPDGYFQNFPIHAMRLQGKYLIEQCSIVYEFSGALFCQRRRWGGLRRWFALAASESAEGLPEAEKEAEFALSTFPLRHHFHAIHATRKAIRRWLPWARIIHFACHAEFDKHSPVNARLRLPSGESWSAAEWLDEPVDGLGLATLCACKSGASSSIVGHETFGLVAGMLAGGVRAVLAGNWELCDAETFQIMQSFYRHCTQTNLAEALAQAQREAIRLPDSSPVFWGPFCLFGDPMSLPPLPRWVKWLAGSTLMAGSCNNSLTA